MSNTSSNIDKSEQLRESLLDLERANQKERDARSEAEALLGGLYALTNFSNRDEMFRNLLDILRGQIGFENAFILATSDQTLKTVASTSPQFLHGSWPLSSIAKKMTAQNPTSAFFDVEQVPSWKNQTTSFRQGVCSALHVLLRDHPEPAILVCTHSKRGYFSEKHLKLSARFAPLASQALINLDSRLALEKMNAQLHQEIAEKQKAQAMVVNSSKMAALGEMAGGIAHEINTPLAAIIVCAELMEMSNAESAQPDQDIARRTKSIIETGERIAKIIVGLKNFSRDAKNDETEKFPFSELYNRTIALCGEKFKNHGVRITVDDRTSGVLIEGQIVQLTQVMLNLLNNSFDAIKKSAEKWIAVRVSLEEPWLEIRVTDSGVGIDPKIAEKIFQPFFTTKDVGSGTGLGLSISGNIVKNHRGTLTYDATSAHTSFVIRLPAVIESKVKV